MTSHLQQSVLSSTDLSNMKAMFTSTLERFETAKASIESGRMDSIALVRFILDERLWIQEPRLVQLLKDNGFRKPEFRELVLKQLQQTILANKAGLELVDNPEG